MSKAEFRKKLIGDCETALKSRGFIAPRKGCRLFPFNDDFFGWVGLNKANYSDFININPFIGIHCSPLMKLCSELQGEKYKMGQTSTVAWHLGEICPDIASFDFYEDCDIEPQSTRLAHAIVEHGLPFMKKNANYDTVMPKLYEKVPSLGGAPERYAVALYLTGQLTEAKQFIEQQRAIFMRHGSRISDPFNLFSDNLLMLFNESHRNP